MAQTPELRKTGWLRRGALQDPAQALQKEADTKIHWYTRPSRRVSILSAREQVAQNARIEQAQVKMPLGIQRFLETAAQRDVVSRRVLDKEEVASLRGSAIEPLAHGHQLRRDESGKAYVDAVAAGVEATFVEAFTHPDRIVSSRPWGQEVPDRISTVVTIPGSDIEYLISTDGGAEVRELRIQRKGDPKPICKVIADVRPDGQIGGIFTFTGHGRMVLGGEPEELSIFDRLGIKLREVSKETSLTA